MGKGRKFRWTLALLGAACLTWNLAGSASAAPPAPVSPEAEAAGLIDVRSAVPDAVIDLRYATPNNFVGVKLYPSSARCLVHQSLADGLAVAADQLRAQGKTMVFWDCYRPHAVQVRMFEAVPNPNWVARPTGYARSHESGRSVDVSVVGVDMGTDFDDFSPRSHAYATDGVTSEQRANRALLRSAMEAGSFRVYSGEWWHFDGPGAAESARFATSHSASSSTRAVAQSRRQSSSTGGRSSAIWSPIIAK